LHIGPIALAFLHVHARTCLHMLRRLVCCLGPKNASTSPPLSRQSRLETLVFTGKTVGFAAEGVGFELVGDGC